MATSSEDTLNSAKFFYFILKLLGLAPYRFDAKSSAFKMSFINYFGFFLSIIIYLAFLVIQLKVIVETNFDSGVQSYLLDRLWQYQIVLQKVFIPLIIIFQFMKRKHVQSFIKLILKFDHNFERIRWRYKVTHSYKFARFLIMTSLIMSLSLNIVLAFYGVFNYLNDSSFMQLVSYSAVNEFFFLLSMQFIFSTYLVYARLLALSKHIRWVLLNIYFI